MTKIISKIVFIAVVVWATIQLYEIKQTYPFMTNVSLLKEYWYYVLAIGVAMSQIMTKND